MRGACEPMSTPAMGKHDIDVLEGILESGRAGKDVFIAQADPLHPLVR